MAVAYPLVTVAYVARALGPEPLGKYYFASSLASYFLVLAGLGIPLYGNREVARARANPEALRRVFSELFTITFVSNFAFAIIYAAAVLLVPDLRVEARLFGVLSVLFLSAAFNCDFLYAGLERQDLIAYRSLISKACGVVLILLLVHGPGDYVRFAAVLACAVLINTALGLGGLRYWAGWKALRAGMLARHVRPIFYLALATFFVNVSLSLDTVLVGLLSTPHEVGLYGSVMRPTRLVNMMAAALIAAALPRLSYYLQSGSHDAAHQGLQKKSLELLMLVCVPAACVLMAAPEDVVRIVYGVQFLEAAASFRVAAVLLLVNALAAFGVFQGLMPLGKEKATLATAIGGAVTSVLLNLLLIPRFGHAGAVWATLAAETASLAVILIALRRSKAKTMVFSREVWKYGAAGLVLMASLVLLPPSGGAGTVIVAGLVAMTAYGVSLWILREPFARQAALAARARLSAR